MIGLCPQLFAGRRARVFGKSSLVLWMGSCLLLGMTACSPASSATTRTSTTTDSATVPQPVTTPTVPTQPTSQALAPTTHTDVPTLGQTWAPDQLGYGEVRPSTVFNGGDPTGYVSDISWSSWGDATATGSGTSTYVAPNQTTSDGTTETATITAFDLGMCKGKWMYRAVEWFFPQHGEAFDSNNYIDICNGQYVSSPPSGTALSDITGTYEGSYTAMQGASRVG